MPINVCGVSAAESNRVIVRVVAEDPLCWAVTPVVASTKTRELRITSSSLAAAKDTAVSNEIRADRMVPSIIEVAASTEGDIETEFSAGSHDDFMQAFLLGEWSRAMTFDKFVGPRVAWTSTSAVTITGGDYRDYFTVGNRLKTEGFINAENNNYWTIASLAFTSGNTVVTMSQTTAVVEAASDYTALIDANDAFVVRNTAIRLGSVAGQIDSNGGNAFAAARAAGQLIVGQRIYVEGLGYETGEIAFTANPADGDTVTIGDGEDTIVFEFDNNSAYTRGRTAVTIGADEDATATALAAAINLAYTQRKFAVAAKAVTAGAGSSVDVTNYRAAQGGSLAEGGANTSVTAFSGGVAAAHGFFTVLASTDDTISVSPAPPVDANAGALAVTIKGSHVRNPGVLADITKQSFSLMTGFTDVGHYFMMKGLRVGGFSQSVSAGEIVTMSYSFMGRDTSVGPTDVLATAPYVPLATTATEPMNATVNVGSIRKNGVELPVAIKSIEIEGDAGLRAQTGVSSKYPIGIGYGRMSLSGKMEVYFETLEMYDHFIAHDTISLAYDFRDVNDNIYTFTIPAAKITADPIAAGGIDQDITEPIEFTSQRDPSLNTQFMVDRFSSLRSPTA